MQSINPEHLRPIEAAVNDLGCLRAAWEEHGIPSGSEIDGYLWSRLWDHLDTLGDVLADAKKQTTSAASARDDGAKLWEMSEGFNDPLRRIADAQKALGTLYDSLRKESLGEGVIGLCQDSLALAERELLAVQDSLAGIARAALDAGDRGEEEPAGECLPTRPDLFPAALARYRSAAALRERLRHAYGTEEADAAIDHEGSRYRVAMHTEAVTAADVLAKLDLFEEYRIGEGGNMDRDIEGELAAAFADVRDVLAVSTSAASPAFAARVQAWRMARDRYMAEEASDDATIDPLHDAKQEAYNALLAEPAQTFGDVLAMARTIKEEDQHGTPHASHYEVAFDALLDAVESLASEDAGA